MTLADELAQTNTLLREAAQKTAKPPVAAPDPFTPRRREPERVTASTYLLAIPGISEIMRAHFKTVPPDYSEQHEDKSRTVRCLCGEQPTIDFGQLHTCRCHRIFWNGVTLKCAPAPESDEVVICDGPCAEDFKLGEGRWVRIDEHELYVCERCAMTVPGEVI